MMFFAFLTPGILYGLMTRSITSQQDLINAFNHAVKGIAPVIVRLASMFDRAASA